MPKYKTIPDDHCLSIERNCFRFKRVYALCTECGCYISYFKRTWQECLYACSISSAANLNTIAHITTHAVAYAAILSGNSYSYRI